MKIVLFHTDEYFVKVFIDFIVRRRSDIELISFTSESVARQYLQENKVLALLSEEGYLEEYVGKLTYILLGMVSSMPKENGVGGLNIYQKASILLEDFGRIVNLCTGTMPGVTMQGREVVVYSTEGGSGKTTIAYLMAVQSAKQSKTLYWNLELLPATDNLYCQNFRNSMEEIMFKRQSDGDIQSLLYDTLQVNADGVYVLPAVQSYGNYRDMDVQLINELCGQMYTIGIEQVILDLPGGLNQFTDELLSVCSHIIWVFSDTPCGRRKEENVKQDPSLSKLLAKSSFVHNFCASKTANVGAAVAFPRSGTLGTASLISTVLEVNPEFVNGCKALLQTAEVPV